MAEKEQSHIPKGTTADAAHALLKGALSGIPVAGGILAEFFSLVLTPQLGDNPAFITTVMHATQVALRTHQQEKLDALRNAVMNAATGNTPEEDLQSLFLTFIEEFTPTHLRILNLIRDRTSSANLPLLRNLIEQKEMTDQMVLGLARNGLLHDSRPYAARGRDTGESLLTFSWTVSRLGEQFLAFISPSTPR
jgi:hypothetical protein